MLLTFNTQDFAALFLSASLVVSKDSTRPHIAGVAMQFEKGLARISGTDGHRAFTGFTTYIVTECELELNGFEIVFRGADIKTIGKALSDACKKGGPESITIELADRDAGTMRIGIGGTVFARDRETEKFPPVRQVVTVPTSHGYAETVPFFGVNAGYMADSAKMAKLINPDSKSGGIEVMCSGSLNPVHVTFDRLDARYVIMPMRTR
jgi:DNA polymerase III sliding clamp (beta) subunit (PCNA family)